MSGDLLSVAEFLELVPELPELGRGQGNDIDREIEIPPAPGNVVPKLRLLPRQRGEDRLEVDDENQELVSCCWAMQLGQEVIYIEPGPVRGTP